MKLLGIAAMVHTVLQQQAADAAQPAATGGSAAVESPANIQQKVPAPAAPFPGVSMQPTKFHFKKNELGEKRPTVELFLPTPQWDGVVTALNDTTAVKDKEGKE